MLHGLRDPRLASRSYARSGVGFRVARLIAENVGPQILTSDLPICCPFDGRAVFRRNFAAFFAQPVPNVSLLDGVSDRARQGRLPLYDFDCSFKCVHEAKSTNILVALSTSSFVVTDDKRFCNVVGMRKSTYQDRIQVAIERAGGQSELARMVNERYGTKLKPQNIQYLARKTPNSRGKVAGGSRHSSLFASVVGLVAEWLESGEGPQDVPNWKPSKARKNGVLKEPLTLSRTVHVKIKETGERITVELTTDALKLAKLFMDMAVEDRKEILRQVETKEIKRKIQGGAYVPDEKLGHLAAPGTATAELAMARKRAKAAKPAAKKPMSKHSQ